jgi:hypothetical protein
MAIDELPVLGCVLDAFDYVRGGWSGARGGTRILPSTFLQPGCGDTSFTLSSPPWHLPSPLKWRKVAHGMPRKVKTRRVQAPRRRAPRPSRLCAQRLLEQAVRRAWALALPQSASNLARRVSTANMTTNMTRPISFANMSTRSTKDTATMNTPDCRSCTRGRRRPQRIPGDAHPRALVCLECCREGAARLTTPVTLTM